MLVTSRIFIVLPLLLLLNCYLEPIGPEIKFHPGMVTINADRKFFLMGSTDRWAAGDEKPQMNVGFLDYFQMDTVEVTVAQYWNIVGMLPESYVPSDTSLTTPICFITWYDAILFCNLRSRAENIDTVYTYSSIEKSKTGRTYRINNLQTDFKKYGYRLPTEAEWEFAAHGGKTTVFPWGDTPDTSAAGQIAWYSQTAFDQLHPVGSLEKNAYGIYDLFGNVAEWVNDWKGFYTPDTLINYIGPSQSYIDEHPIKGGSYLHALDKLRPSSRSDSYSTLSSTATKYIGFRCCIGQMSTTSRLATGNEIDSTNPLYLTARSNLSWLPSHNARLVFVNSTEKYKYLCYINFNEYNTRIYQFTDITPVYAPTISPDGKWVAFCTRGEGASLGSEIYLRQLDKTGTRLCKIADEPAFIPRWWVDPATRDTFIVYTNSAEINESSKWSGTYTKLQKISDGTAIGAPIVLCSEGSFHGGLSIDKKYLATGYPLLRMKNLVTSELKTLFTAPQNGKPVPDTSQVCNVSISPDNLHPDRVMFLDFGSGLTPSTIVGSTYGVHEVIFIADYSGKVAASYRCPSNLYQWDNPEWSNHPDYAVATARTIASPQTNSELYVINLRDTTYHKCVEGTYLLHPFLWISENVTTTVPEFDPDSAGWYNDPPNGMLQKNFAAKMPHFLKSIDLIEVLGFGSSRMQNGFAPKINIKYHGFNFGYAAGGLAGMRNLLNNYALPHCPRLKLVAISLDICWFNLNGGDYSWVNSINQTKGNVYDENHNYWTNGFPNGFIEHLLTFPEADDPLYRPIIAENGWYANPAFGWGPNPPEIKQEWDWNMNQNVLDNIDMIHDIVLDLKERSIHFVGILFPQSPYFQNTSVYGIDGPSTVAAQQIIDLLKEIEKKNDHFHVYDAHLMGNHDYTDSMAFDNCHLSEKGGYKFSERFNVLIDSILTE
jgi:uncharacterized protein (TIGR02171 family)